MGAGVNLFKTLFPNDYYPYTANTLMSAKPTGKVIKDENDQTIETIVYSGNELRGLLKVGTNGLYADGDIDDGSGSTAVRYEERAYQSGDESLANAITDGTNTVVKKATPTTATSTAWSNPIVAKQGGTETFVDNRTIALPTGHDTIYGTDLVVKTAEFGQTVYGGSVDFTTGEVISNKNADGSDKTPETIAISPVMVGVFEGNNNIVTDAQGTNTVKYFKKG